MQKGREKQKVKGQQTKLRTVSGKFWLMRVPVIEVLLNFVPNPRKISPFSKKTLFLAKLRLI